MQNSGLPFVLVNMAMTADGKIATANRAIHSFSSARDLAHLYELRATVDAVMCGARTVEISRSILDPGGAKFRRRRLKHGLAEYNLRVIVSGSGSIDPKGGDFQEKVFTAHCADDGSRRIKKTGAAPRTGGCGEGMWQKGD